MASLRYRIGAALLTALELAAQPGEALDGVVVLDNPRDPQAIRKGRRIVFVEDQSDRLVDQAAQQGKRVYVFTLGVINRDEHDRAGADADHEAAEAVIRATHTALMQTLRAGPLRETSTVFRAEGIDVGGALVLATFEVEYLKPRP